MRRSWSWMGLLAIIIVAACTPTTTPIPPTPTLRSDYRVAIVFNAGGSLYDGTFNESAYVGAQRAAKEFGFDLVYRETTADSDYPAVLENVFKEGRNVIITTGFQMIPATVEAAKKHPEVFYLGVDQGIDETLPNYVGLQFREDQGGFLIGTLAGMMTKTNVVGMVAGMKIPPVERWANGFTNGVKYVNPQATVLVNFTSAFDRVDEGQALAKSYIDQKADVIFGAGGLTGSGAIAYAASQKVLVIGVDQDEYRTTFKSGRDKEYLLSSAIKRVDMAVYQAIKSIMDKQFKGGNTVLGADQCGIAFAPFHDAAGKVPATVKSRLETIWRALAGGTLHTGAGVDEKSTPEPLQDNGLPIVRSDAPQYSDCAVQ